MIHTSPHGPVDVPHVTVHDAVLATLDALGERPTLTGEGRTWSAAQVADAVRGFAGRLGRAGVGAGDVVALGAPNSPEWLVGALGALAACAVFTTLNPQVPAAMAAGQLRATGATRVLTTSTVRGWAEQAAGSLPLLAIDDVLSAPAAAAPPTAVDPAAPAALLWSSGTGGLPKAVVLSHRAFVAGSAAGAGATDWIHPEARVLVALPLFHTGGLSVALAALIHGAHLVVQPGFDPPAFLGAIQEHGITMTMVVPPIVGFLAGHPLVDRFDTSSLQIVACTAAPLHAALEHRLGERLGCAVGQAYAMSEGVPFALSHSGQPHYRPGTAGTIVPNTQVRLVDPESGRDVPVGEMLVRGPQLMSGYLDDPAATATTLDEDGWLHTGDLCSIDEHGVVTVEDRVKELIKTNGQQVPPALLEAVLLGHPAVHDCAVVARQHPTAGEVPVACVVTRPGTVLDAAEIQEYVAARVAPGMRLAAVLPVDEVPRNPTGKILRRVLREQLSVV